MNKLASCIRCWSSRNLSDDSATPSHGPLFNISHNGLAIWCYVEPCEYKSSAKASTSRYARYSKIVGSVTPLMTITKAPRWLPSFSLHNVPGDPISPEQATVASAFTLAKPSGGGIHLGEIGLLFTIRVKIKWEITNFWDQSARLYYSIGMFTRDHAMSQPYMTGLILR